MSQKALFAAGCFWGIEDAFKKMPGVLETTVGYSGGHTESPSYDDVCSDTTGHAETVEVVFDPEKVSFEDLVRKFFDIHNPTTINRQGPDVGSQYRSAIFYLDEEQKAVAEQVKKELDEAGEYDDPIVTEVTAASTFWPAEEYHQDYYEKNPGRAGTC